MLSGLNWQHKRFGPQHAEAVLASGDRLVATAGIPVQCTFCDVIPRKECNHTRIVFRMVSADRR